VPDVLAGDGFICSRRNFVRSKETHHRRLYRDEVYNPGSEDKGKADIVIGKQRNCPMGTVCLTFLSQCTRFEGFAAPGSY